MTVIYFIRHCEPNFNTREDRVRELTEKGLEDRKYISDFFTGKDIDIIFSSPYKRCLDTIEPLAISKDLLIHPTENFKERRIGTWVEDFNSYAIKQWNDFDYKLINGESLSEVQSRNILELNKILHEYESKNIVIATHGTAFSTILNYYNKSFDYQSFQMIKSIMPFISCMKFDKDQMINCDIINPFTKEVVMRF